jgi:cephalosporin hydroxylase
MITTIDEDSSVVIVQDDSGEKRFPLASNEGFMAASNAWLRCGWDAKHVYSFTWMGRPVIQLPEDLVRIQEVIYRARPDFIIETGIAHGGSLIFYASLFKAMGKGHVLGIDIDIRAHNRAAIEGHELFPFISLIEGSSTDKAVVEAARRRVTDGASVMVILDSNHSKTHVAAELDAYADIVSPGSYLVVTDGVMKQVTGAPRTAPDWTWNNPLSAIDDFLRRRDDFLSEEPPFSFNEGLVTDRVTYWPRAFLRRKG